MNILLLILLSFTLQAETYKLKKLVCSPFDKSAAVEVIFPKLINPLVPFIGLPELSVEVTVKKHNMDWTYVRDRVLVIPEKYPPGVEMRGQSSDSLYLKLHPEINDGLPSGVYFGQLFVNDHESEHRAYFRYLNSEYGPGLICQGSL